MIFFLDWTRIFEMRLWKLKINIILMIEKNYFKCLVFTMGLDWSKVNKYFKRKIVCFKSL